MRIRISKLSGIVGLAVLLGACSKDAEKKVVLTYTIHVSLDGASSRALTEEGVKTFAEGDQIAVIYKNESNETLKAVSNALTSAAISVTGKNADFTVSLEQPLADGALRYIYPAVMAAATVEANSAVDADANINYAALETQDGTLASLASNLDLTVYDGQLSGTELPENPILHNKLTIGRFTLMNYAGTVELTGITSLTVSDGANVYNLSSLTGLPSPVYVAMRPISAGDLTFTATDGASNYEKSVTGKTLAAGSIYPVSLRMLPAPLSGGVYNGFLYDGFDANGDGKEQYEW